MTFEWDEKKNAINKRKHGIPFEMAVRVFWMRNELKNLIMNIQLWKKSGLT